MKSLKNILKNNKDLLWQGAKVLLAALQFLLVGFAVSAAFHALLKDPDMEKISLHATLTHFAYPLFTVIFFFGLWHYYDSIDDRSFKQFCQAAETPRLLRDRAYILAIVLTALTATPILAKPFHSFFQHLGLKGFWALAISLLVALLIAAGGSVMRISRLNFTWEVQKKLPHPKEFPSPMKRIFYAALFFVSSLLLARFVFLAVILATFVLTVSRLLLIPTLIIVGMLFLWYNIIRPTRNIRARRKFLARLQKLQAKGELTVTLHGHPYLSILFERFSFGLTVIDTPHPDSKIQENTVYQVTFANCKRRRYLIILCEENVYQFVYALQFNMITRFSRMGAVNAGNPNVPMPGFAKLKSHSFEFPEGEGERILLIDPPPIILAIRNEQNHNLIEIDNASKVYGYSVYGKNAFINMLERT